MPVPLNSDQPSDHGPREPSNAGSVQSFGVTLAFISIGVFFVTSLLAVWITRQTIPGGFVPGSAPLPRGLWLTTGLLAGASFALEGAWRAIRANAHDRLRARLGIAAAFGGAFVIGQWFNWRHMFAFQPALADTSLHAFAFYVLTGLHAAHVVGGFVPLVWVMTRARQRQYSSSRCQGIKFCVQYWHFLGIIWCVLLANLYLMS